MKALLAAVVAFALVGCQDRAGATAPRWTPAVEDQLSYLAGGACIGAHVLSCKGALGQYYVSLSGETIKRISISMAWADVEDLRRQVHHALRDLVSQRVLAGIDARLGPVAKNGSFEIANVSVSVWNHELASTIARPDEPKKYDTTVQLDWL